MAGRSGSCAAPDLTGERKTLTHAARLRVGELATLWRDGRRWSGMVLCFEVVGSSYGAGCARVGREPQPKDVQMFLAAQQTGHEAPVPRWAG